MRLEGRELDFIFAILRKDVVIRLPRVSGSHYESSKKSSRACEVFSKHGMFSESDQSCNINIYSHRN